MIKQADIEAFLKIAAGTDTALLVMLEAAAVEWLENRCGGRYFRESAETIEYHRGHGQEHLFLEEDVDTGQTVTVVEQAYEGDSSATTITAGDDDGYTIRGDKLTRKGGYVWQDGYEYKVTYTRGYEELGDTTPDNIDAPPVIRLAVLQIIAFWYNSGKLAAGASQLTSEKIGDYSYTRGPIVSNPAAIEALPGVSATIDAYERHRFV